MSEVDERVVQMKFDNAQFEAGVQQTLQSLNKLNDSIEKNTKANSGKSLTGLTDAVDGLKSHFANVETSVKSLTSTFSPLGIAGKAAVENITNKLTDLTLNCAKTLTGITSMQEGFSKFSDKSMAVSTLMTATGASMDQVSKAMDNLNWFTDETSYNFTDMIDTMSKFSASGVKDLGKLTKTVEGIALWGAKAGANSQTVSRAMYQLSQAVGRGYITYQDWLQSAVNTNMATSEIKKQLLEAGGAAAKSAGAYQDFNDSLKKGWLTIDVFNKVMDQYTEGIDQANYKNGEFINSQNGAANATTKFSEAAFRNAQECKTWADVINAVQDAVSTSWGQTYEYIFGNYIESKKFFTALGNLAIDVASRISEARNQIFSDWNDNGGREALIKSLVNTINALYRVIDPIVEAFGEVFGEINGKNLAGATTSLEKFTQSLLLSREAMINIKSTFIDIFSVLKSIMQIVKPFVGYITSFMLLSTILTSIRSIMSGGLGLGLVLNILKIIVSLGIMKKLKSGSKVLTVVTGILKLIAGAILTIVAAVVKLFKTISSSGIVKKLQSALKIVQSLGLSAISKITQVITKLWSFIKSLNIGEKLKTLGEIVKDVGAVILEVLWKVFDFLTGGTKLTVQAAEVGKSFDKVGDSAKKLTRPIDIAKKLLTDLSSIFGDFKDKIKDAIFGTDDAKKSLDDVSNSTESLNNNIGKTTGVLSYFASIISGIPGALASWKEAIKNGDTAIQKLLSTITEKVPILQAINWSKVLAVGTILLYALAIRKLDAIAARFTENFSKAFSTISSSAKGLMMSIGGAFDSIGDLFKAMTKNYKITWFKNAAVAIGILTASLIALGFVPWQNLLQGSVVIVALAAAVTILLRQLARISVLIDPVKLNSLSLTLLSIANLLGVMTVAMGAIALVTNHVISSSQSMTEAIIRISAPLAVFAVEIGSVIGILAVLSHFSPALVKLGAGIAAVAGGILAFSVALVSLQFSLLAIKVLAIQIVTDVIAMAKAFSLFMKNATIDPTKVAKIVLIVSALIVVGVAAYAALEKLKKITTETAKTLALLAVSMLLLSAACKVLSKVASTSEDGMISMAMIMEIFFGSIVVLGTPIIQKGIENLKGVGKAALALSASMLILAGAVAVLGSIDGTTLAKGIIAISIAMISLGGALAIIKSQTGDLSKAVAVLLAFTFAMYALVPVIALFGAAWQVAAPGVALVSAMMLSLAASCQMMNKVNAKKIIAMVATMGVALLGLLYVFESLSEIDSTQLITIAGSLAIAIVSIGASVAIMSKSMSTLNPASLISTIAVISTLALASGVLAEAAQKLANVPYQNILSFAAVLGVFGAAAAAIIVVISHFSGGLLVASPALLAFAAILASAGIAFVGFGAGSVLFGKAVEIITSAITAFIPSLEQFITFIASLSGQAVDILQVAGSLAVLGVALVPLGVGMTVAATGASLLSGAVIIGAVALTSFGNAANLAIPGISGLLGVFEQLITFCAEMGTQVVNLLKMAGVIAVLGAAFIPFGTGSVIAAAGIAVLTAALYAFSAAINAFSSAAIMFSAAVDRVTVSIAKFKTSVLGIKSTITELNGSAKTWGSHLGSNFAKGMSSSDKKVAAGANSIAKTVWRYLHFSNGPEEGAIAGNSIWTYGSHLSSMFGDGILNGDKSTLNAGLNGIADYVASFKDIFANKGTELAESFGSSLTSGLASALSWASDKFGNLPVIGKVINKAYSNVKKSQSKSEKLNKFKKNQKNNASNNEYVKSHGGASGKKTDINNNLDIANIDDFLTNQDDLNKALGNSTDSLNTNTGALSDNSKGSGSASKSTEDLAEQQKVLAKYTKYAAQTMDTYMKAFGMAFSAANSTDLISNTKEAFGELAEYIYQETQKNSDATTDATQTAEERAQAVMKAFNEAFESIRDSAKSSLDMFSSFDKKLSEKITPKEMLANFESQEKGITQFYNNLGILAAKGFNTGMVKSLMDEGPSAYAKVSGLLEATGEEIDKLNEKWNSKESVANKAAASAMTALMTSMQITKLKTLDAQRKKSVDTANESLNKYKEAIKSAQEANLDMEATLKIVQDQAADTGKTIEESGPTADLISSYNDLQKAMTDAGLSNEDLQTAMMDDSGFKFTENSMLMLINKMADLKATIAQFEDIGSQINDNVKSQLSSSVSYFDEWSAKYEMTGDQLMKNVQSQIEGIAKYNDSIKTIISNGGGQIVSMFGDKITPEIANAMAQLGNSALQTLQQQLQYIQAAPVQAGQQAQQAWFQYGQIGGMGYQTALSQLAQDQALMAQATNIGTNVAQGAVNGMTQSTSAVAAAGQQVGQAAINGVATGAQTHSPSVATTTMGQNIDQGLINGVNALSEAVVSACRAVGVRAVNGMQSGILMTKYALLGTVNTLIQQIITTFRNGLNADIFSVIGMQICNGLINGINAGRFGVINAAVDVATKAYAAVCEALDIGSPSRKMYWVGKMFDAGFTNGIRHGSEEMQHTVRENMETAVQTAVDLMNNTGEMQPTIRPVVDLSDAQNGSRLLSSMFSDIGPMRVNTGVGQITTPTDRMNAAIAGMNSGNSVTNGDTVLNIYATPGQNTKELADIVIKRLNNEYARRKAAWT